MYDAYSERPKLSREYNRAISKMIDQTYDIDSEQFDFDEVAKGKCKEFDDLVIKLCAKSGLGSADIYSMLLERFIAEYDMDYDVNYVYGLDELEESKKTTKRSLKESKDDLIQVTEDNPVFPYWVYDTHRKVLNDIFDMCFYKKKFDIFVTSIAGGDKVEIYIVNDDMTVILTKETANIIIHKINEDNKYLADLSYASSYKTSSEIDEYVDKRWYGQFLKDFLNVVYKY